MSAQRFRVIFAGEILPGFSAAEVKLRLAKSFKMPAAKMDAYFTGRPVVLKSGLDAAAVDRFRRAFHEAGGVLRVQAMPDEAAHSAPRPSSPPADKQPVASARVEPAGAIPPAPAAPASSTMTCPRCGAEQAVGDSCISCGVIIAKARRRDETGRRQRHIQVPEPPAPPTPAAPEPPPAVHIAPPAPPAVETSPAGTGATVTDDQPAPDTALHPPLIETAKLSVVGFLATCIMATILNLFLIGILLAPRMIWDFIMSHVHVDDRRLSNADLWLGLRPLLWLPASIALGLAAAIPVGLVVFALGLVSQRLAMGVASITGVAVGVIMLAPLQLGLIRSLVGHTTNLDGDHLFIQPFALGWRQVLAYLSAQWRDVLLGGVALFANMLFFTTPLGTAITLRQFFNCMQANGYRFELEIPWKKTLVFCLLAIPSLGIANLFFVRTFIHEVVPSGVWVPVRGDGEG